MELRGAICVLRLDQLSVFDLGPAQRVKMRLFRGCISPPGPSPSVWVIPTDEEGVIAGHTLAVVRSTGRLPVDAATSGRQF